MTQKEIIEFEETNTGVIRLYLEGSFYKAYERSAFAFCTRIKDYRVLRKESKTLGRDILYVGFPMIALDRTLGNAMTRKVSDTVIDVILSYPMNENEFLQWRDAQEVEQASVHSAAKGHRPCTCGVRLNQWCGQRQLLVKFSQHVQY